MKRKIFSILLAFIIIIGLIPVSASNTGAGADKIRVVIENTTFPNGVWTGTLVDTWVDIDESSTMMSCFIEALGEFSQAGAESGYITSINNLNARDGGDMSGWMGTLNDWFTNSVFSDFTVANGRLESGDEIRMMYSLNYGEDLGSFFSNNDKAIKSIDFSTGITNVVFDSEIHEYILYVPYGTDSVVVTPTACNKNFQVRTSTGNIEYKRSSSIPIENGSVITVKCGDPEWPTMNNSQDVPAEEYSFTVTYIDTIESVDSAWSGFRGNDTNNAVTTAKTPTSKHNAPLLWANKLGSGWASTPSAQIIADNSLVVMCGKKLHKLNLKTGAIEASSDMVASPSVGSTPPTYAEGMIFCPLGGGVVQAFNAKTLQPVWMYKDELGGQALTPITYSDGYIYTGFWNSETKDAAYVCISVEDETPYPTEEKAAEWRNVKKGGFYWAGSVVVGNYIIYGGDNGVSDYTSEGSVLASYNKLTGEIVSSIDLSGDQRSTIVYADGKVYFTTKNGTLHKANFSASTGELGELVSQSYSDYGTQSTSTPVFYDGVVYFTTGGGIYAKGHVIAVDSETLDLLWAVPEPFYPQCSLLLSAAYEDNGVLYLYTTYNGKPGGIDVIKVTKGESHHDDIAEGYTLYDAAGHEQFCICNVICDTNGNLYYKNDSGTVFALASCQTVYSVGSLSSEFPETVPENIKSSILLSANTLSADGITAAAADFLSVITSTGNADYVRVSMSVESERASIDENNNIESISFNIKPMYTLYQNNSPMDNPAEIGNDSILGTIAITLTVPDEMNIGQYTRIKHNDELITPFINGKTITFETDSFSTFEIIADARIATVKFVLNGGTLDGVDENSSMIFFPDSIASPLPAPTRDGYIFDGWYSKDGLQIKKHTDISAELPAVLHAEWTRINSGGAPSSDNISVSFRLIGSSRSTNDVDLSIGQNGYYGAAYTTWIKTESFSMPPGSTVGDLFKKAVDKAGLKYDGLSNNYITSVTAPKALGGYKLDEFTNGQHSGWMYSVNGNHPNRSLSSQVLRNNDVVVWHFVNDYRYEVEDWFDNEQYPALGDGTLQNKWLSASDTNPSKQTTGSVSSNKAYVRCSADTEAKSDISPSPSSAIPFGDVSDTAWYYNSVKFAYENKLFSGVNSNNFDPDGEMTRAMLVTVIHRLAGEPDSSESHSFADVDNDYYTKAVMWSNTCGIITGVGKNSFAPSGLVTREQLAVMLMRYAKYKGYYVSSEGNIDSFSDAQSVSDWASEAVKWANHEGIITGKSNSIIDPAGNATRAEVAAMLQRFAEKFVQ